MSQVEHTMAEIERTGSLPMVKTPISAQGRDAMMAASVLSAEVVAFVMGTQSLTWQDFGKRVILLTTDGRDAFLSNMRKWGKDIKENELLALGIDPKKATEEDKKKAAKKVRSYGVQLSNLNKIAAEFNQQATIEGLLTYWRTERNKPADFGGLDDVPFNYMFEYARSMGGSVASSGDKTFAEKLAKFLEKNKPVDTDTDGCKVFTAVVTAFNATQE